MIRAFVAAGLGLCPGDVVTVTDAKITFVDNLLRRNHERRFCVVLSNNLICEKAKVILVAPMTHDTSIKSMAQLEIEATTGNGLDMKSRVILDQIQPILKSEILEKKGRLSDSEWENLMTKIVWNFDRA